METSFERRLSRLQRFFPENSLGSHTEEHKRSVLGTAGSPHPSVRKLKDAQVIAIRESNKTGRELAREFGVSNSTIRNIKNGRICKEVG